MKIAKRIFLTVLVLFIFLFLLRGWLYRHFVTYKAIGERVSYVAKSPELIKLINTKSEETSADPKAIVEKSLSLTSYLLKFKAEKNDLDPNNLIDTRNAHCVGYANFFATLCNEMFERNNLADEWVATSQKGQLYFMGVNIHPYFKSAFFRDHDFVIIKHKESGEIMAVDPSLHDYTGIRYVTLKR